MSVFLARVELTVSLSLPNSNNARSQLLTLAIHTLVYLCVCVSLTERACNRVHCPIKMLIKFLSTIRIQLTITTLLFYITLRKMLY